MTGESIMIKSLGNFEVQTDSLNIVGAKIFKLTLS
ncbi:MAG: NADPH-dependent 7-cyano-7-deazaguanine reductase QueF-like protein [Ulvibacter sp.]|jgi:NADPH-dependent 7-cyano-7-deazaguanine reductase QueF-like protein